MRLFLVIISAMLFFCSPGFAQEDSLTTATSALQDVLTTLQQSVEKLSVDNNQLEARDNALRNQALQLQSQLGQLQEQGDLLDKKAAQLQEKNPRRAEQITRLEKENYDLDNRTQKAGVAIKATQESLQAGYEEDRKLLLQLKAMTNVLPAAPKPPSPEDQAAARLQKEKLKLMKMIYESQERQEAMHRSIMELQKNVNLVPAAGALAHQQLLKDQIKDLEAQIAAYPSEKSSTNYQLDDSQLQEMEQDLKVLERNYAQLKDLMEQMNKKAQDAKVSVSQHIEGMKLQSNLDDLNHQGIGLMNELDDLRSQMVELDKRKSHLETIVAHLP